MSYGGTQEADRLSRMTMDQRRSRVLEGEFMQQVIDLALTLGWLVYHTHDSRHSPAGFPDLILVRGDRLVALECKRDGQKPTAAQVEWLEALAKVRWVTAGVARPGPDFDEIEAVLR